MSELKEREVMTEEELRAINPEEFEGVEYQWTSFGAEQTVIAVYDYDIGLSLVDKDDHEDCCVNHCGPSGMKAADRWQGSFVYRKRLTIAFKLLRSGSFDVEKAMEMFGESPYSFTSGSPSCSFT